MQPREDEPPTPVDLDLKQLPRNVKVELRGLTPELADIVGAHLLMAGQLIDTDPELAYRHAEAARRRASRLPITREAAAEAAYAAGLYDVALSEFRALRRMQGGNEYLAAMADCERALDRPQAALKLIKEGLDADPDISTRIELRIVEAGVRESLAQVPEALRLLRSEIENTARKGPREARARLRYAYADLLEKAGDLESAEKWFSTVILLDEEGETDAEDRLARLQGVTIIIDEADDLGSGPDEESLAESDNDASSGSAGSGNVSSIDDTEEQSIRDDAPSVESGEDVENPDSIDEASPKGWSSDGTDDLEDMMDFDEEPFDVEDLDDAEGEDLDIDDFDDLVSAESAEIVEADESIDLDDTEGDDFAEEDDRLSD